MQFDSLAYLLLLLATGVAFFHLPPRARVWLLILASLIFYAAWSIPFTGLIILSAVLDYGAALGVYTSKTRRRRLAFLMLSMVGNLGLLGYFKYANFFLDNLRALVGEGVVGDTLSIVLPPGISFYTFQTMSYTIDVYRGQLTPTRKFDRLFLFVTFFPQLVAGPIERAGHLMTQFEHAIHQRFRVENLVVGARMIIYGLAKKVLLSDACARLVEPVYAQPEAYDGWTLLVATYAFTLQIYFDFSAYSEIARGSARLFGIDLMRNFDQPYLASNPSEFWRRWHISLSTWIRDYVYLPLGGNRGSRPRVLFNLVVTMFLSGLWHGAAWTFVLWGLYHGVLLLFDVLLRRTDFVAKKLAFIPEGWRAFLAWMLTFHLVVVGWILFRAETVRDAWTVFVGILSAPFSGTAMQPAQLGFFGLIAAFLFLSQLDRRRGVLRAID
ncbi:MAG TPA: MBOAT family protein, partial [Nannocystaceae bacterium]|nr:MBOAT family protein [Nannocystaceae bacterium]